MLSKLLVLVSRARTSVASVRFENEDEGRGRGPWLIFGDLQFDKDGQYWQLVLAMDLIR